MATTVWALDASAGAPNYTGAMLRNATVAPFAGVAPVGFPLGARSGVRPGTPASTAFLSGASNFTWNVAAHAGIIQAETSATAGPYAYWTDGTDTGTVNAANGTYPRIDILYVQINDAVQDASGLESGLVGYLAGTAASTPSPPATPAQSMVLAQITVPASGGGNPAISWKATSFADRPICEAYQSTGQSVPANTVTALNLQTTVFNNDGIWVSGSPNQFTIVTPGTYSISGAASFPGSAASGYRQTAIQVNGSTAIVTTMQANSVGATTVTLPTRRIHLNAGDVLQLVVAHSYTSAITMAAGNSTFMSILREMDL